MIQLMYGVEWNQPAIIAEALAQASIHKAHLADFLLTAEKQAASAPTTPMPRILALWEAVRSDEKLAGAVRATDNSKLRDGVLGRAKDAMLAVASRVCVAPDELDERTAEMFHACVFAGAAAAVHPPKHIKFDFFLM